VPEKTFSGNQESKTGNRTPETLFSNQLPISSFEKVSGFQFPVSGKKTF